MRVLTIIGTRPEALKLGPVLRALAAAPGVESVICATGQHRRLVPPVLDLFGVRPTYRLLLRRRGQGLEELTAQLVTRLAPLVRRVRPDWILAVGDTTSVLAASLVAAHQQVRFAHVEAGLRSAAKTDPFPEEIHRRVAAVLADLHLAPTAGAARNLRREGIPARAIGVTGNPIIDTLQEFAGRPEPASLDPLWRRLGQNRAPADRPRLVVVTFHRRENIGRPVAAICAALRDLARTYRGRVKFLCILHPNPAVRGPARRALAGVPHVVLAPPLDYPAMLAVLRRAHGVLTDSGGLQEELPAMRIPVLVLRRRTERPEGVAAGVAKLVGTERAAIVAATRRLLDDPAVHRAMARGYGGYGDGRAAGRIVRALLAAHRRRPAAGD